MFSYKGEIKKLESSAIPAFLPRGVGGGGFVREFLDWRVTGCMRSYWMRGLRCALGQTEVKRCELFHALESCWRVGSRSESAVLARDIADERVKAIVGEVGLYRTSFGGVPDPDTTPLLEMTVNEASAFASGCFLAVGSSGRPVTNLTLSQVRCDLAAVVAQCNALVPRGRMEGETKNLGLGLSKRLWEATEGTRISSGLGFAELGRLGSGGAIRVGD